jgi:phosphonate transport system permease protein
LALRLVLVLALLAIIIQAAIVVRARPQDLITGAYGMADIIRRAMPPDFSKIDMVWWPALETIDLGIFGTIGGVIMALPLAVLAAANVTPSRLLYYLARGVIGFARAVPDLVWALLFVTAVGLGPFPGALALSVHSIGMLGRLFAETIEHMDMAPIDALTLTGARRVQVFTHGIIPSILPSLLGIALYRLDENIRSSLVLRFCRRRRDRFRAAVGDEPVSVPAHFAADRRLCHRDCRRAPFSTAPRPPRLSKTGGKARRRCIE